MTKVRFAPSPTGYLHPGNVRTALINWLFTRSVGGKFVLRIDDTDLERSKPEYEQAIKEDLQWLGLHWDEVVKQSDRFAHYSSAAEILKKNGRLYACYDTPDELEIQRKQLAARGLPPVYNRAGLKLTDAQKSAYEAEGRKPHWRFLLEDAEVSWNDLIRGRVAMRAMTMSDPVLVLADGVPVYTLASVVDDGDMAITHVIRGEDHVSNTAVQVQLYQALGYQLPQFAHMALLKTKEGELSKRLGGNDIKGLREQGILPMAVNNLLSRIGTSQPAQPYPSLTPLVESFSWQHFGRAAANYDVNELQLLNAKLLHHLPFADVKALMPQVDEAFWLSVRGNITSLNDVQSWWQIVHQYEIQPASAEDSAFLAQAAALVPPEPWDATTWDQWMHALKSATDRKGKALFMPIRKALTGMEHGPELKVLLPLLGRTRVLERLA